MPEAPENTPDLLITPAEVQNVTNRAMSEDLAAAIAQSATDAVRDFCGWRVAKTKTETLTVPSRGSGRLFLPTLHVTSIAAISDGDTILTPSDFDWGEEGVIERIGRRRWTRGRRSVRVTLTHGYDACPGGIAQAIAAAVARGVFVPAGGLVSESAIGQTNVYAKTADGTTAGAMFTPAELDRLTPHRIGMSR
jgi:hypothetical protein